MNGPRPRVAARIRVGEVADAPQMAEVIAEAFADLPVSQWLVTPDHRDRVLRRVFGIHADHAARDGVVHLVDGAPDLTGPTGRPLPVAAALWLPTSPAADHTRQQGSGVDHPEEYDTRLAIAAGPWADRFRALDAAMHAAHPTDVLHHHLAFLAVRPGQQGAGLGTALLRRHHRHLDRDGIPAYLEASSPESRDLYLRHGYEPHGLPFTVPGGPAPTMWPMWRPAGRDTTGTR